MKRFSKLLSIGGACLILLLVIPSQAHADTLRLQQEPSYSVLGPPTVSVPLINRVLASYHSPAAGKGQALFEYGVKYGVDPVFALAFFMHESSFGTTGIAQFTLSLGNLRCIPMYPCYNGFSSFATWEAGFDAWYSLIRYVYVDTWHLSTVEQIIPTYAPASDHNDVAGYISAIESAVDSWRAGQITDFGSVHQVPTVSSTPPVVASTTVTSPTGPTRTAFPADHYSILGKPGVEVAFINQILSQYHSPASGKGSLFFEEGMKYDIDPIYALAFFMLDSIFGTEGLSRVTHSLGPLPTPTTVTCHCQDFHGYRRYATWDESISDWFHYIHDVFIKQKGLTTVSQIVSVYLRTTDTSAIRFTIKEIENRVDLWKAQVHTH